MVSPGASGNLMIDAGSTAYHRDNLFKMGLMFTESGVADGTLPSPGTSILRRRHSIDTVRDGTSTTVMMSENINAGFALNALFAPGGTTVEEVNWACPHPYNTSFFVRANTPGITAPAIGTAALSATSVYDYTTGNERSAVGGGINGDLSGLAESQFPYPNSQHPGGVNLLMCDGSTRFLTDSVDGGVWARIVTPDGGNLAGTGNGLTAAGRASIGYEDESGTNKGNKQKPVRESDLP